MGQEMKPVGFGLSKILLAISTPERFALGRLEKAVCFFLRFWLTTLRLCGGLRQNRLEVEFPGILNKELWLLQRHLRTSLVVRFLLSLVWNVLNVRHREYLLTEI